MKNNVVLTNEARIELHEIEGYITSELGSPKAAKSLIKKISRSIDMLEVYAYAGAPLSSVIDIGKDYRFLVSGNYLIFYKVEGQNVYIEHIMYGGQNYIARLFPDQATAAETLEE